MRSVGLLLLVALMAFVPVVQAQSCVCGGDTDAIAVDGHKSSCCCAEATSCSCPGCREHEGDDGAGRGAVAGCICTKGQPQSTADQPDEVAAAEVVSYDLVASDVAQSVLLTVDTLEVDLRPPVCRPLLV